MNQQYDYDKILLLTDELLEILMNTNLNDEALALFIEKVNLSESYFNGVAATAFRDSAQEAITSFSIDNLQSVLKLINVAQMPRNNAEAMKVTDKIVATKMQNGFKSR